MKEPNLLAINWGERLAGLSEGWKNNSRFGSYTV